MPVDKRVTLEWAGDALRFRARGEGFPTLAVDGDGVEGPSPMDALLLALAGCMAVDVVDILEKSRVPVTALRVEAEGERNEDPPRRFHRVRLEYVVEGPGPDDRAKLERAVALSRETYCSVLHSLREDLDLEIRIRQA